MFAWFLRELWQQFEPRYIVLAAFGSVIIDIDHFLYYFTYGRHEDYAREARKILRAGQIGTYIKYCTNNHKNNTSLLTHNVYVMGFFVLMAFISFWFDWKARVVIFGAIVLHFVVDLVDDLWVLGHINDNWKRLRRKREALQRSEAR